MCQYILILTYIYEKEFVKKIKNRQKTAFTLAEVLITLGIIGVVAAIIIPTIMANITQNVFSSAQDLALKKIRAATDQMRADDVLSGYTDNDSFADVFQKYIKTVKRCDSSHLQDCFSSTFLTPEGDNINVSSLTTGDQIGQSGNSNPTVGIGLINDTSMILAFKPSCDRIEPSNNTIDTTSCLAIVYDTNGSGKPNQIGKDISLLNATVSSCSGTKISGLCVSPSDITYSPYGIVDFGSWNGPDYWAGAKKACGDMGMRLPTPTELDSMYQHKAELGMTTDNYWSDQQVYTNYPGCTPGYTDAGIVYFGNGTHQNLGKTSTESARCVK